LSGFSSSRLRGPKEKYMESEDLTQAQKHNLQASNVNISHPLVGVVQHDETTNKTVLLLNNQVIENGGEVDYRGKKLAVNFGISNVGTVPDEPNMDAPWQFISIDRWDPIAKTIVSYTTPYWGPEIPAHPVVDENGTIIPDAEVPAIPSTMRPGRTVVGAVVFLTVGGVAIKPDNHGLGSKVDCKPDETSDGVAVILDRWNFTIPWAVFGYSEPKRFVPDD
jgi:hypothetical protein